MPADRTRIALVGAGYWGPNWIRTILGSNDSELAVVCDSNPQRRDFVSTTFPGLSVSDDFDSVIGRDDVDALIIATPPESHEQLGVSAIKADKHVLVEKPLAVTESAAVNLVTASQDFNKVLAVGHVFAYNPAVTAMCDAINSGDYGKLLYANSSRMNLPPPTTRHSVIWDLAVHDVSIALTTNPTSPTSVSATAGRFRHRSLFDAATLTINYEDDTKTWHHVGWLSPERVRKYFVGCERGTMEFDDTLEEHKLKLYGTGIDSRLNGGGRSTASLSYSAGEVVIPKLGTTRPLEAELRQFVSAISGGPPPIANGRQGLLTVKILSAAETSAVNSGQPVLLKTNEI